MKISIITVCLNAKETIEDTFLSIFNQTYNNIELIVVDGVSKDSTLVIIDKYKDKITYFISEKDNGIYDAMNKGIKASNGDFIVFLNANDVFYDNFVLEKVAKALDENPQAEILFGDVEYISADGKKMIIQTFDDIKNNVSLIFDNICHQSIFYKKTLFERYGRYSKEFKIYADWDFNIKTLVENQVAAIYLPIIISKFQLGGICSDKKNRRICKKERKILIDKYYKKIKPLIILQDFLRKHLKFLYIIFMKKLFSDKKGLNIKQIK